MDAEVILEEPSTQAFSGSLSVVSGECEAISEEGSEKKRDLEAFIRYACSVFDTEPVGPEGPPSLTASRQTPTLQVSQDDHYISLTSLLILFHIFLNRLNIFIASR